MPSELQQIYDQLKDRYPLTFTNTFALDDGFTADLPIIVGRNAAAAFWLYDDGILVFSVEVPGKKHHDHWHPQSVEEAVQAVIDFMEGR